MDIKPNFSTKNIEKRDIVDLQNTNTNIEHF